MILSQITWKITEGRHEALQRNATRCSYLTFFQVIQFRTLILNYSNNWGQRIKFASSKTPSFHRPEALTSRSLSNEKIPLWDQNKNFTMKKVTRHVNMERSKMRHHRRGRNQCSGDRQTENTSHRLKAEESDLIWLHKATLEETVVVGTCTTTIRTWTVLMAGATLEAEVNTSTLSP